jgi:hypothetical protein
VEVGHSRPLPNVHVFGVERLPFVPEEVDNGPFRDPGGGV